jgi:hypothetical protein
MALERAQGVQAPLEKQSVSHQILQNSLYRKVPPFSIPVDCNNISQAHLVTPLTKVYHTGSSFELWHHWVMGSSSSKRYIIL